MNLRAEKNHFSARYRASTKSISYSLLTSENHNTNILPLNKKQKRHRIAFFLKICQLCTTDEVLHRILMEFPEKKEWNNNQKQKAGDCSVAVQKKAFYDVTLRAVCRDDDRRIVIYIKEDTPLGLIENTLYDLNVWRNIIENGNIKKEQDLIERTSLFTRL